MIISALLVAVGVAALTVLATPAAADVTVDGLTANDTDHDLGGNVSDVTLTGDLAYEHDVTDADQRVIELQVAPDGESPESVAYIVETDPADTASGTVTLTGSIFDHSALAVSDVQPAAGETTTTELTVRVEMEITQTDGETVMATATDTATLTLTADGDAELSIGGEADLSVQTAS